MNDRKNKEEKIVVIKRPKPKEEEEDLDDFIFKDEPVKLHSER